MRSPNDARRRRAEIGEERRREMTKAVKAGMPKEVGSFGRLEDKIGCRKIGVK